MVRILVVGAGVCGLGTALLLARDGVVDRYRRFLSDDIPVATGLAAVADAWTCTNPSAGRGLTAGINHAVRLRDAARQHIADPAALAREPAWRCFR